MDLPYYSLLFTKTPLPAFTVDLLAQKTYVITTSDLAAAVQRNSKTISFDPLLVAAANHLAGITGDGLKLLDDTSNGGSGVSKHILHAMHPALLGQNLDEMNRNMIERLEVFLNDLYTNAVKAELVDLHGLCRHAITVASTDSVYGPLNPYLGIASKVLRMLSGKIIITTLT
ncbi:hypothetical protein N7493_010053 [Penicillium malachiteum]|uniref:Uncharacterized protein n=1 Tax=Penicillium malachiteum TaxID=1324776 RepID=A0AAD6MS61_9EURO|nr:hypothetical protein N7493_010053 [Penicillium malachiteum]